MVPDERSPADAPPPPGGAPPVDRDEDGRAGASAPGPAAGAPGGEPLGRARDTGGGRGRRGLVAAVAVVGAVVLVGGLVVALGGDDDPDPTDVAGQPGDTDGTADTGAAGAGPGVGIEPSTGLADGDTVTLTLADDPGGELVVRQCAGEVTAADDVDAACGRTVHHLRSPAGSPGMDVTVAGTVATPDGRVDCTERPGRCVLRVEAPGAAGGEAGPWYADLGFAPTEGTPAAPEVRVEGTGEATEGDEVTVAGAGYPVGDELLVRQCLDAGDAACDDARAAAVTVGEDGSFELRFVVSSEVLTAEGWQRCEPCLLQTLGGTSGAVASEPLRVTPGDEPLRPTLAIAGPGPHAPGAEVTLEGRGFQPAGTGITIGACTVPAGGAPPDCAYPEAGLDVVPADDGTVTVTGYPLPDAGDPCGDPAAACVLAWYPNDGGPAAVTTPLDLG
jgi:hypothetical protein